MTVQVSKASVIENIYKNFYDLTNAISGFSGIVYPAFPDVALDDRSNYPVIIINSAEIGWDTFTFGKNLLEGTLTIDIYTTSAETSDQYASDIHNQIETSKFTLAGLGLRQVHLLNTDTDMAAHGLIRVHLKSLTFEYKFYFAKTAAF